jgi:uncharacterized protein
MSISRRQFLGATGAVAAGFWGLRQAVAAELSGPSQALVARGYGPLIADPQGIISLPRGFGYKVIARTGDEMADGLLVPGGPDGMATFRGPEGSTILICNHENMPDQTGPFGKDLDRLGKISVDRLYDAGGKKTPGCGGTSTIVFDTREQKVVRQFMSLAGTYRNCAGGPTPWNSWVTCEETVDRAGGSPEKYTIEQDHGYNFEVPATHEARLADPMPLKQMGRFNHEAIAVDPASNIVYQTEDRDDGLIYRYLPNRPGDLKAGGKLQFLSIAGAPSTDTRNWDSTALEVGQRVKAQWQDIDNVESPDDDLRLRGFNAGAARFARGEGMWTGKREIYFACTSGGKAKVGQIFRYVPSSKEGQPEEKGQPGTLELFVEPNDSALVCNADNLTVAPWGDLIVCEDRQGPVVRLVGVRPNGKIYTFAHNHVDTEFAGAVFSPDGSTLFVNMQGAGLTLAITGPWRRNVVA